MEEEPFVPAKEVMDDEDVTVMASTSTNSAIPIPNKEAAKSSSSQQGIGGNVTTRQKSTKEQANLLEKKKLAELIKAQEEIAEINTRDLENARITAARLAAKENAARKEKADNAARQVTKENAALKEELARAQRLLDEQNEHKLPKFRKTALGNGAAKSAQEMPKRAIRFNDIDIEKQLNVEITEENMLHICTHHQWLDVPKALETFTTTTWNLERTRLAQRVKDFFTFSTETNRTQVDLIIAQFKQDSHDALMDAIMAYATQLAQTNALEAPPRGSKLKKDKVSHIENPYDKKFMENFKQYVSDSFFVSPHLQCHNRWEKLKMANTQKRKNNVMDILPTQQHPVKTPLPKKAMPLTHPIPMLHQACQTLPMIPHSTIKNGVNVQRRPNDMQRNRNIQKRLVPSVGNLMNFNSKARHLQPSHLPLNPISSWHATLMTPQLSSRMLINCTHYKEPAISHQNINMSRFFPSVTPYTIRAYPKKHNCMTNDSASKLTKMSLISQMDYAISPTTSIPLVKNFSPQMSWPENTFQPNMSTNFYKHSSANNYIWQPKSSTASKPPRSNVELSCSMTFWPSPTLKEQKLWQPSTNATLQIHSPCPPLTKLHPWDSRSSKWQSSIKRSKNKPLEFQLNQESTLFQTRPSVQDIEETIPDLITLAENTALVTEENAETVAAPQEEMKKEMTRRKTPGENERCFSPIFHTMAKIVVPPVIVEKTTLNVPIFNQINNYKNFTKTFSQSVRTEGIITKSIRETNYPPTLGNSLRSSIAKQLLTKKITTERNTPSTMLQITKVVRNHSQKMRETSPIQPQGSTDPLENHTPTNINSHTRNSITHIPPGVVVKEEDIPNYNWWEQTLPHRMIHLPVGQRLQQQVFQKKWFEMLHPTQKWENRSQSKHHQVYTWVSTGLTYPFNKNHSMKKKQPFIKPFPASTPAESLLYQNAIQDMVDNGAAVLLPPTIKGISEKGVLYHPSFLLKQKDKIRPIVHFSIPTGLNHRLLPEKFKMETVASAIQLAAMYPWAAKFDIRSAYFHLFLNPKLWKLCRFKMLNKILEARTLLFGMSPGPQMWTKITKQPIMILRQQGIIIVIYIDDILVMGRTEAECRCNLMTAIKLFQDLGFLIKWEKTTHPSQTWEFLGWDFNTISNKISVPLKKLQKIKLALTRFLAKPMPSLKSAQQIIGYFTSIKAGMPHTRLLTQRLITTVGAICRLYPAAEVDYTHQMTLTSETIRDLTELSTNLSHWNGISLHTRTPDFTIHTDASGKIGWGGNSVHHQLLLRCSDQWNVTMLAQDPIFQAHLQRQNFLFLMKHEQHPLTRFLSIAILETQAVEYTLQALEMIHHVSFQNKRVLIKTDNTQTVACLNKMGTPEPMLSELTLRIGKWCQQRNCTLILEHLPGIDNIIADSDSRRIWTDKHDWQIKPAIFQFITTQVWQLPDIDLFAEPSNKILPCYCARHPDPLAFAVNAFSIQWTSFNLLWINPPWVVLDQVLSKIQQDNAEALVLAPIWPTQVWYPRLLHMLIDLPLHLPSSGQILQRTVLHKLHQAPLDTPMAVWRISGNTLKTKVFQQKLLTLSSMALPPAQELTMKCIERNGSAGVINENTIQWHPQSLW